MSILSNRVLLRGETNKCGCTIKGVSLTVPNLAPSLQTYLAMASRGEQVPIVGSQLYDDSPESGAARLSVPSNVDYFLSHSSDELKETEQAPVQEAREVPEVSSEQVTN